MAVQNPCSDSQSILRFKRAKRGFRHNVIQAPDTLSKMPNLASGQAPKTNWLIESFPFMSDEDRKIFPGSAMHVGPADFQNILVTRIDYSGGYAREDV